MEGGLRGEGEADGSGLGTRAEAQKQGGRIGRPGEDGVAADLPGKSFKGAKDRAFHGADAGEVELAPNDERVAAEGDGRADGFRPACPDDDVPRAEGAIEALAATMPKGDKP